MRQAIAWVLKHEETIFFVCAEAGVFGLLVWCLVQMSKWGA